MLTNNRVKSTNKIAIISSYLPRKCGIGVFTYDLCQAFRSVYPSNQFIVIPVTNIEEGYDYSDEARFEIIENDINSYRRAADFLNLNDIDVVLLQHEYGLYGRNYGINILKLLKELQIPVVVTLHTILDNPIPEKKKILKEINSYVDRFIVMSEKGKKLLQQVYKVVESKIDVIPHGIHDVPFIDPNFFKDHFGVEGKRVLLTFGLLSSRKGIEFVLNALPEIIKEYPNVVYIVLGATHPNSLRSQGEFYRLSLESLAKELNIAKHVIFHNRFVELEELKKFIGMADIFITPYLYKEQITSGALSYALGAGKAIISTPYWHAEELLSDNKGILVPFNDLKQIANKVLFLLKNEIELHNMRKRAYLYGRNMIWPKVAISYFESFNKAREMRIPRTRKLKKLLPLVDSPKERPLLNIGHLLNLTDNTGILQNATYIIPNYVEGYTTDDNARALIASVHLEELGQDVGYSVMKLETTYLAFLQYAWNPQKKRFRNYLSYERQWKEEIGSEDSHARALWAIGVTINRSKNEHISSHADFIFEQALPSAIQFQSIRAWAFTLLGIHEYLQRLSGDRAAKHVREILIQKLIDAYNKESREDWKWFEDRLTYCNAILPYAQLVTGHDMKCKKNVETAIDSINWLLKIQKSKEGFFQPIGSNGFYLRDSQKAKYDQQPVEAYTTILACLGVYKITHDKHWKEAAETVFEWFLGRNSLQLPLYNPSIGGCRDGLHSDRVSQNHGAESTLSFLLSLLEIRLSDISIL